MKKIISLLLAGLILFVSFPSVSAENAPWEDAVKNAIAKASVSESLLMDISSDGIPELFMPEGNGTASYYYDGSTMVKAVSVKDIPFDFLQRLVYVRNTKTDEWFYMGQALHAKKLVTYKMSFYDYQPVLEVIAEEFQTTTEGTFKGDEGSLSYCENVPEKVLQYLENYETEYLMKSYMDASEIRLFGRIRAAKMLVRRFDVLSQLTDDSLKFTSSQRDKIKLRVGKGSFLSFDKITVLNNDAIFVEYYVNEKDTLEYAFPYDKRYALISGDFDVIKEYTKERYIDANNLWSMISPEAKPSNFKPDYKKTSSFRGIDDYVTYFSSLISLDNPINENGKKEIANFMEFAVNKCSRTEVKAKNNVITIRGTDVSIVAQNAVNSMGQLTSVCQSKGVEQIRTAKTVPELVCAGIDFSKPIRCEFENGVAQSINQASGIRIMLDENHGIYVNQAELSVLEKEIDVFAVEFTKNEKDYSVVFTDKNNETISDISVPVWVIVPAKSDYSSVLASYDGGTENRGGQYDQRYNRIEFSAVRSGNYQIVEEDITINDIDSVSFSANQAIRFLVSKGVLDVDRKNNFRPNQKMSRYDFTKALVNMFYAMNSDAKTSYTDIKESNRYYDYVATAEAMGMTKPFADDIFGGEEAVTNEYILSLCGKVLAEKKGYKFPDNYVEYLQFLDKEEISASSMPYIAVAVQYGLAENNGEFLPKMPVTREKGAQILYKTFTLLYDTSPVTTSFSAVVEKDQAEKVLKDLTPVERGVICVLITAVLALAFFLIYKKRKPENQN